MLPLDPMLTVGAKPAWIHHERSFDEAEFAVLDEEPESPERQCRFARHLLDRDSENIWAMHVLAGHALTRVERIAMLREAARVGVKLWAQELAKPQPSFDWGASEQGRIFLGAVISYGVALGDDGHLWEVNQCFRLALALDPQDTMGAKAGRRLVGIPDHFDAACAAQATVERVKPKTPRR